MRAATTRVLTYTSAGDASQKFVSLPPELQGSTIEIVLVEHAAEQQWYTPLLSAPVPPRECNCQRRVRLRAARW